MGELRPARLEGHAHDLGHVARAQGFPEPAGLDRQVGRRLDDALGGRVAAASGARVQDRERTYGDIAGANLLDWPITLAEMEPYYASAEDKMGVTRTNNLPGLPGNNNFKVLEGRRRQARLQGSVTPAAWRSTRSERDDRDSCQQTGFCFQGCKWGAKWSTLYTEIPKGEATGNLEVRPDSHVAQIEHDASGKVTGVVYFDKDGKKQRQKARVVAVAGNSIESPRLLLNSASSKFPDGLANSSGQVGRNYMRHMTGSVYAVFDKPVHMYRGTTMAGIVRDEARYDTKRGFVGGYEMETLSLGLPFMAAFLDPGAWGREFTTALDCYVNMAGMWIVGEDMPQETNRITLERRQGPMGPAGRQRAFRRPPQRRRDAQPRLRRGAWRSTRRSGATRRFPTPPYPSTHNLGTNRMSENPRDGVVNKHGQTHDIKNLFVSDGSQFTTGGAENPTLTIVSPGDPPGRLHRRPDEGEYDLTLRRRGKRGPPRFLVFRPEQGIYRQDFRENSSNEAAMASRPKKNVGTTVKCRSGIHHDSGSEIKPVSAGTNRKNIVTKPLSLPVVVNAT